MFHLTDAEKAAGDDPTPNQPIPGTTFLSPVTKFFVKQTFTRFQEKMLPGQALQGRSGLDNAK
jgi:hypothetical protein